MSTQFNRKASPALVALALAVVSGQAMALVTISNGIYDVHIDDDTAANPGSWNAVTGSSNPTGTGNNILFSGNTVSTNFSSLNIYSPTGGVTTYTPNGTGGSTDWGSFLTSQGASTTYVPAGQGYIQNWNIPNANAAFSQELAITGTTLANSAIYHTVTITNTGPVDLAIGWRNLYDWTVNDPVFDDGPSNTIEIGGVPVVLATTNEFSYTPTAGSYVRVAAAPPPTGGATYEPLLGLGFDPGFIGALPVTTPELYAYVSWPSSFGTAFSYTPTGGNVTGDSAGLSWFGTATDSAIFIAAGDTARLTQTIYAVPPGGTVPGGDSTVPEPETLALLGIGLAGLAAMRRSKTA